MKNLTVSEELQDRINGTYPAVYTVQDDDVLEESVVIPDDNDGLGFIMQCMYYGFNR